MSVVEDCEIGAVDLGPNVSAINNVHAWVIAEHLQWLPLLDEGSQKCWDAIEVLGKRKKGYRVREREREEGEMTRERSLCLASSAW